MKQILTLTLFCASVAIARADYKVIGGQIAEKDYPWQVALVESDVQSNYLAFSCGGTLIREDWVLTAAHCFHTFENEQAVLKEGKDFKILIGSQSLVDGGRRLPIEAVHLHPNYNPNNYDNDIALLQLTEATQITPLGVVRTSNLPSAEHLTATVIGWGNTSTNDEDYPVHLMKADVRIIDQSTCEDSYQQLGYPVTSNMLCAGYPEGGIDACSGDSGGPLLLKTDEDWQQIGIVSWGEKCAEPGFYGVYTRLSRFKDWIDQIAGVEQPDTCSNAQIEAGIC